MNTKHSTFTRPASIALALALVWLSACAPRSDAPATDAPKPGAPAQTDPATTERPAKLIGPAFTLIDQLGRPLECVILAKAGSQVLVQRTSDKARYLIDFDRLSPDTQRLLGNYSDANQQELRTFVHNRDYAEAKRKVRVEMISATWCGYCTQAKNFFSAEGITYAAYDHESAPGKQRKQDWGTSSLPAVKIGDRIMTGFNKDAYIEAVLAAYRKDLANTP